MEMVAVVLVLLFVVLFVSVAAVSAAVRRHLRTQHPEVWQTLGAPSLLRNNSVRNWLRLERYLWTSQYRTLSDGELDALARREKVLAVFYWASFIGMILAVSLVSK